MQKRLMYFFLFIGSYTLSGQHTGIYIGADAAFQNTWILNSEDLDVPGELDFEKTFKQSFGFELGYKFDSTMGIQLGVIYSEQGQKYITKGNPNANYKTDLVYLKFPVLFCYHIFPLKKLSLLAQGGLQLNLLSEAKSSRKDVFGIYSSKYNDVKDYYTELPIDVVLALGLQYRIQKMCINLLVRSDYSVSDIEVTEKKPGLRSPTSNLTIAIPQLSLQYFFK